MDINRNYSDLKKFGITDEEDILTKGKLQVQVSHPDKPVSACCN